jgi:hypothetical protein
MTLYEEKRWVKNTFASDHFELHMPAQSFGSYTDQDYKMLEAASRNFSL